MSFKTPDSQGHALLVFKDRVEIFLTEDEYTGIKALMTTPNVEMTTTELDDGSLITLSSISRIQVLKHSIPDNRQLEDEVSKFVRGWHADE